MMNQFGLKLTNQIYAITSIREFTSSSAPIYMYDAQGGYVVKSMGEVFVFPYHISPERSSMEYLE